jgi:hypothetical protein
MALYCPNDFVTRAQMALFMQRLGVVFTDRTFFSPTFTGGAPLDPDASPIVCTTTGSPYTATYPQSMILSGAVGILAAGAMNTQIQHVYSTDGGATWTGLSTVGGASAAGAADANVWYRSTRTGQLNMDPNVTYVFGMRVTRAAPGGAADGTDYRCGLVLSPFNRNPTTSPLRLPRNEP